MKNIKIYIVSERDFKNYPFSGGYKKTAKKLFFVSIYRGGSPLSNPYFRTKPKLSVFENGQFSGHFFFTKTFQKNVKCHGEEVLEIFLTLKKNCFFQDTFFEKKNQKNF